ncbi:CAP domain-containing protein [Serpentinicella sp. ANB-PHB4]|uniref:CAP domain-containing protein n=1 Tax=Serpentinicella sp. ANB-PHB4 TaxID=3074076 RepID=UPI002863FE32|nr:CAP domain-containing protein [Serpentinicella sp. ANB-PHB4]MDR5658792.1 CAP domain-containing protein [Serpentinicella sp. ANB-PHB4]
MKKRKWIIATIIFSMFIFSACTGTDEVPDNRQGMQEELETNHSSIFKIAPVRYTRILSDKIDVKSGFGNRFDTIGTLDQDEIVRVLDEFGDWYAIELDNHQIGAIPIFDAQPIVRERQKADLTPEQPVRIPTPVDPPTGDDVQETPAPPADPEPETPIPDEQDDTLQPITEPDTPAPPGTDVDEPDQPEVETPPAEDLSPGQPDITPPRDEPTPEQPPRTADGPLRDLTDQESQMVELVNQERERNNLPALEVDLDVTRVARVKSQDMVDHDYFSHNSPTYGSPFDMLDDFGISYLHAGENLAGNNNVQNAHTSLMNSSGHRRNILSPDFTHIGIGVKPSPRYGYVYTQMFISKPQ